MLENRRNKYKFLLLYLRTNYTEACCAYSWWLLDQPAVKSLIQPRATSPFTGSIEVVGEEIPSMNQSCKHLKN
jgi:hypothetical protein